MSAGLKIKSASPAGEPPRMTQLQERGFLLVSSPHDPAKPTTDFPGAAENFCSFLAKLFGCTREICGSPSGGPYGDDTSKKPG
ncbi:hypothetical protein, partial [Saccharothrix sp.]|uniref:hypothetical protein n=1 Tax=Saccharothrix sp. TaxID=1873460 RepID=UPI00281160CB